MSKSKKATNKSASAAKKTVAKKPAVASASIKKPVKAPAPKAKAVAAREKPFKEPDLNGDEKPFVFQASSSKAVNDQITDSVTSQITDAVTQFAHDMKRHACKAYSHVKSMFNSLSI